MAEEVGEGKPRRWRDGSLEEDLPMRGLAEMFNVNYFICSQTNPHIVPALNIKRHLNRTFADLLEHEFKHRCVMSCYNDGTTALLVYILVIAQPCLAAGAVVAQRRGKVAARAGKRSSHSSAPAALL